MSKPKQNGHERTLQKIKYIKKKKLGRANIKAKFKRDYEDS